MATASSPNSRREVESRDSAWSVGESAALASALGDGDIVRVAAALGLLLGLGEVALLAATKLVLGKFVHLNPQIGWLAPTEYALAFAFLAGIVLVVGRQWRPSTRLRVATGIAILLGATGMGLVWQRLHEAAVLLVATGVAVQGSHLIVRHPVLVRRWGRRVLVAGGVLIMAFGSGLNARWALVESRGLAALPPAPTAAPSVLVIIWDTARAASMSLYGYVRETTPTLDSLAAHGVVFNHAMSPAPWTLPSHASMFTGLSPAALRGMGGADWRRPLGPQPPTLAEVLRDRGYRSGGFVANLYYTSRESGLHRGFLHYADYPVLSAGTALMATSLVRQALATPAVRRRLGLPGEPLRKVASTVDREFLDWVGDAPGRPFFAFLNFIDAHAPYSPPAPFDSRFGPLLEGRDPDMVDARTFTPRALQAEIDAYDGAIAYLDHRLSMLLGELDRRGLLRNTLVVVSSDHGEEFGEHRVFTHGNSLYDPVLHVPLLLALPGALPEGVRVDNWVTTTNLPATILDVLGGDRARVGGRSLRPFWSGDANGPDTLTATVTHATGHPRWYPVARGDMTAIMADPMKYIRNGDGAEELYNLREDPGETRNLVAAGAADETLQRMRRHAVQVPVDSSGALPEGSQP